MKHHRITEAQRIPLAVFAEEANYHDVTEMLPLVDAMPSIGGKGAGPENGQRFPRRFGGSIILRLIIMN